MSFDERQQSVPEQPVMDVAVQRGSDLIEFDVMKLVVHVVRSYKTIGGFTLAGILVGLGICFHLPKTYTAQAVFMPPPASQDITAAAAKIALQDPSDLYMGMLGSRAVADSVIEMAHLQEAYHVKKPTDARGTLAGQSKFGVERNSFITVTVKTGDPKLSATIANAYLDALYKLNGSMAASNSMHREEFFEEQLGNERRDLEQAESRMKEFEEKTGTVLPEGEAQAGLSATARLQENIEESEARLSGLLTGSTEQNPQVINLRAQIDALKEQLREQQLSAGGGPGSGLPSTAKMPGVLLDYQRGSRDLKQQEAQYDSLVQQYERARLAALDPGPQLEIVDRAEVPDRKSGPPRTYIVVVSTFLGGVLGVLFVLLVEPVKFLARKYAEAASQAVSGPPAR